MLEDEDDIWFFKSIRLYKTLQMYELEVRPSRMVQYNAKSLCMAGTHPSTNKSELMCVELPEKLLLPPEEEGRCKGNDFQILSGGFFSQAFHQIGVLLNEEKMIASFQGEMGISLLAPSSRKSNVMQKSVTLLEDSSLKAPNFSTNKSSSTILAAKTTHDPFIYADLNTGQITQTKNIPDTLGQVPGEVLCCHSTSPIIMNTSNGCALALDARTLDTNFVFSKGEKNSQYTISADSEDRVCILSSSGLCSVFDLRSYDHPLAFGNFNFTSLSANDLKVTLSKNRLFVSGIGSCVNVYELNGSEIRHIFNHIGHSKVDSREECIVTDHLLLPSVSEHFVVSCADNGSVNCWECRT